MRNDVQYTEVLSHKELKTNLAKAVKGNDISYLKGVLQVEKKIASTPPSKESTKRIKWLEKNIQKLHERQQ